MDEMELSREPELERVLPPRSLSPLWSFRPLQGPQLEQQPSRSQDIDEMQRDFVFYDGPIGDAVAGLVGGGGEGGGLQK